MVSSSSLIYQDELASLAEEIVKRVCYSQQIYFPYGWYGINIYIFKNKVIFWLKNN